MRSRSIIVALIALLTITTIAAGVTAQDDDKPFTYEAVDMMNGADLLRARAQRIDLNTYPIIPELTPLTHTVYTYGRSLGRDPHIVSKVGDCNSAGWPFLHPFGEDQYNLGPYIELQTTIDFFSGSLALRTYAAHNGLNVAAALDPMWADPTACNAGEIPLACEYRLHNPATAIIMFGTNDILVLTPEQFDHNLRRIVHTTRQMGIVPILSTFPRHLLHPERSILFNQIVVQIALDFNVPLINLWRALEPLPKHGIADDAFHLNGPITGAGDFSSETNLQTGYPRRNLVTLQTLDVLRREAIQPQKNRPLSRPAPEH